MSKAPDVPDTWSARDLPVLRSIVARVETEGGVESSQVMLDTGLSEVAVDRASIALEQAGYFKPAYQGGGGFGVLAVSEKARRAVGAWPSAEALAERLVSAVEIGLSAATSEVERGRWRKLKDGLIGAGPAVLTNAAGSALGTAALGG